MCAVRRARDLYKRRVEAALSVLSKLYELSVESRERAANILREVYEKFKIEPFRGLSKAGAYEKELATVYVVARYGNGLSIDDLGSISKVFEREIKSEELLNFIRPLREILDKDAENKIRELVESIPGSTREERLFAFLRLLFTGAILGFTSEAMVVKAVKVLQATYPDLERRLINYIRFYVAFRIAEQIALGQVRSLEDRRIQKYAYCVRLGFTRCAPSDRLVKEVASKIYGVPKELINKLFPEGSKSIVPKAL